jgi:hypothetical protein
MDVVYWESTNLVRVSTLTDESTGQLITNAAVTAQFLDEDGNDVGSAGSIPHIATGNYEGTLDLPSSFDVADYGFMKIVAVRGGDTRTWKVPVRVAGEG